MMINDGAVDKVYSEKRVRVTWKLQIKQCAIVPFYIPLRWPCIAGIPSKQRQRFLA